MDFRGRTGAARALLMVVVLAVLLVGSVSYIALSGELQKGAPGSTATGSTSTTYTVSTTSTTYMSSTTTTEVSASATMGRLEGLTVQQYNMTVPAKYQSQVEQVQAILNQFNASLGTVLLTGAFTHAAELIPADGDQGPKLFDPHNLQGVQNNLNVLKAMGVDGVTIAIGFPLLDPSFPQNQQYLQYFEKVVNMSHEAGMTVDVEAQVLFANTPYSPVTYDWSGLTFQQFEQGAVAQDNLICSSVKPDIIDLGVEADTEAGLTGFKQLDTPSGWGSFISFILNGLDKHECKTAAGAPPWVNSPTQWMQNFISNPNLDYVAVHSYPIMSPFLSNLVSIGEYAKANDKQLVFDEYWDTKALAPTPGTGAAGFGGASSTQPDVFSFWIPTDVQALELMVKFCHEYSCAYFSPFPGDYYFFGYLNWTPQLDPQTFFQLHDILNPTISSNIAAFTISLTGEEYAWLS